jgi:hypothetical protein
MNERRQGGISVRGMGIKKAAMIIAAFSNIRIYKFWL